MKLAILADIHSNLRALEAVTAHLEQWQPDWVVVAGDIVNRGPRPVACLQWVQRRAETKNWLIVRGNHEDYILNHAQPDAPRSGLAFEMHRSSYWTYQQLDGRVASLAAMPFQRRLTGPDDRLICITHASMQGIRSGIYPRTTAEELRQKIEPAAALFGVGHTHWPLIRRLEKTLVVNAGAVGLPFDGDIRACYAQAQWQNGDWSAEIVRVAYDYAQAERDFYETGFMTDSGALAPLILDEFRAARSHLYEWAKQYEALVMAGQITMEESSRDYMASLPP